MSCYENNPRYSLILPALQFDSELPALRSWKASCPWPPEQFEILVVTGCHPTAQRNAALALARGEWILFWNADCEVVANYFSHVDRLTRRPDIDVVGGPSCAPLHAHASVLFRQQLLGNPGLTGFSSCRYLPLGQLRISNERELILCNLIVRRSLLETQPALNSRLYPNEENEWLDRLQQQGRRLWYDPALIVRRPQRVNWPSFGAMLWRYGMGRTRQTLLSGRIQPWNQAPLLFLLVSLAGLLVAPQLFLPGLTLVLFLYASTAAALHVRFFGRKNCGKVLLFGWGVPLIYTLGQIAGLMRPPGTDHGKVSTENIVVHPRPPAQT